MKIMGLAFAFLLASTRPLSAADAAKDPLAALDALLDTASALRPDADDCLANKDHLEADLRAALAKGPEGFPVPAFCRADFDLQRLETDATAFAAVPLDIYHDERFDEYAECLALADQDLRHCMVLDKVDALMGRTEWLAFQVDCRKTFIQVSLVKAMVSGEPAPRVFCQRLYDRYPAIREAPIPKICFDIVDHPHDTPAVCRIAVNKVNKHTHLGQEFRCAKTVGMINGDVSCDVFNGDRDESHICLGTEAYRKAYAAKDVSLCADSPACRAMMGEGPKACRAFAAAARERYCASFSAKSAPPVLTAHAPKEVAIPRRVLDLRGRVESMIIEANEACVRRVDRMRESLDKAAALLKAQPAGETTGKRGKRAAELRAAAEALAKRADPEGHRNR